MGKYQYKPSNKSKGQKGLSKDALKGTTAKIRTFGYSEDAWAAFYQTPAGRNRLARMRAKNDLKIERYNRLLAGQPSTGLPTAKVLLETWRETQNTYNQYQEE